ncbi:TORC-N domain-containing protein [Aphelenchoides bicaudatus]|nr:TORC-N domain-containing protein [Aphelenchoides bicaudatus]
MSQTPRKFSEKIAILERKSKVEADDFMAVMQDVKKITSNGPHSQQTTPSSTPYPCSPTGNQGSAVGTPAIESPIDGNNLHVMHPLAGMHWQRSGGSLPNVHQMVQQKPGMAPQISPTDPYHQNWIYWQQTMHAQGAGSPGAHQHQRTRSPGSSHFHPYRPSSGNVAASPGHPHRNERVPPLESHMMSNNVHLQPPDATWYAKNTRARSDPAIHINTMNTNYYNPQPNAQFQAQQQYNQQLQQQQWAQMQNGMMTNNPPQQFYAANGSGTPICTTPTGNVPQPQTPSQPESNASSASSVPISINSPQNHQAQPPIQYNGYMKQSPCGSPIDMAVVGSLPNMHSNSMPNQQQFKTEPSQQDYYNYEFTSQNQQEPLQSAPPTMQQYCNGGSVYAYNSPQIQQAQQAYRPQHQLTMPQGLGNESSQSAPTSPAQNYTTNPLQPQWTPTRHYSASPDNNMGIPRVTLTHVEGNTECFQEFQDLCLDHVDNDLQQALMGGEEHFDPAAETQLINSSR